MGGIRWTGRNLEAAARVRRSLPSLARIEYVRTEFPFPPVF